jgi:hypothetical protein
MVFEKCVAQEPCAWDKAAVEDQLAFPISIFTLRRRIRFFLLRKTLFFILLTSEWVFYKV